MIFFRADANEIIATGHVMRCLSIANAFKQLGEDVTFILADEKPQAQIQQQGYKTIVLNSQWNDLEVELQQMCLLIEEKGIERLIIDSYYVTKHYMTELSKRCQVTYIDDYEKVDFPVQNIVNYCVGTKAENYSQLPQSAQCKTRLLLGPQYAPLRPEFTEKNYVVNKQVRNVLITTGGTDAFNVAGKVLKRAVEIEELKEVCFHVVVGVYNQNKDMLYELSSQYPCIQLHENVSNMGELMQMADVAITAAGSTTYELACVGVPSICFCISDNQLKNAKAWEEKRMMRYAGNMETEEKLCLEQCITYLRAYQQNYASRKTISEKMRQKIDGEGARRITLEVLK